MTVDNARLKIKKKFDFTPRAISVTPSSCLPERSGIVGKRRKMAIMQENHTLSYFLVSQYLPITIFGNWNFKPFFIHSVLFQRSLRSMRILAIKKLRKLQIVLKNRLKYALILHNVRKSTFSQKSPKSSQKSAKIAVICSLCSDFVPKIH